MILDNPLTSIWWPPHLDAPEQLIAADRNELAFHPQDLKA
jgi:hypothetical protein